MVIESKYDVNDMVYIYLSEDHKIHESKVTSIDYWDKNGSFFYMLEYYSGSNGKTTMLISEGTIFDSVEDFEETLSVVSYPPIGYVEIETPPEGSTTGEGEGEGELEDLTIPEDVPLDLEPDPPIGPSDGDGGEDTELGPSGDSIEGGGDGAYIGGPDPVMP